MISSSWSVTGICNLMAQATLRGRRKRNDESTYMTARFKNKNKNLDGRKDGLLKPMMAWGEPIRAWIAVRQRKKKKPRFLYWAAYNAFSTRWSARVLLNRNGNTLVLQKGKTDRYEIIVWSNIGIGNIPRFPTCSAELPSSHHFLLPHLMYLWLHELVSLHLARWQILWHRRSPLILGSICLKPFSCSSMLWPWHRLAIHLHPRYRSSCIYGNSTRGSEDRDRLLQGSMKRKTFDWRGKIGYVGWYAHCKYNWGSGEASLATYCMLPRSSGGSASRPKQQSLAKFMRPGNGRGTERVWSGRCWALSTFFGGVLLEPTKGYTEREREQPENCWHRTGYVGTRVLPNWWNKYCLAVDSNLSLSTTVVYGYKR